LQASYRLAPGIKLFVDMRNLNNAYLSQTTGMQDSMSSAVNPGRSYFLGIKWKA